MFPTPFALVPVAAGFGEDPADGVFGTPTSTMKFVSYGLRRKKSCKADMYDGGGFCGGCDSCQFMVYYFPRGEEWARGCMIRTKQQRRVSVIVSVEDMRPDV